MKTMTRKVGAVIETVRETMGGWFVHADCDIQFFGDCCDDIRSRLSDRDFIAMDDNMLCAGFFACRSTPRSLAVWELILERLGAIACEQIAMNIVLGELGTLRCGLLPRFRYFNYMHTVGRDEVWEPGRPISMTVKHLDSMLVHHANYTIGVSHKVAMLEMVRRAKASRHSGAD